MAKIVELTRKFVKEKEPGAEGSMIGPYTDKEIELMAVACAKQVPTKPEIKGRDELRMCPLCNEILSGAKYPYCKFCGQALDWSEN